MADLKIYGSLRSRANRSAWTAKELGIPFEQVEISHADMKAPDFLAINPNGKVPAITDGDFKLFESFAINLYLAKKHGLGQLYPSKIEDEARAWQWSFWTATEIEPALGPAIGWHFFQRGSEAEATESKKKFLEILRILDGALAGRQWLAGDRFSIADLNVASAIRIAKMMGVDFGSHPNVNAWFERCVSRPAAN
jgi:glutathione S-transferase